VGEFRVTAALAFLGRGGSVHPIGWEELALDEHRVRAVPADHDEMHQLRSRPHTPPRARFW